MSGVRYWKSRLNDKAKGCIILIMQRLHQEDLVGHVLEQEPWEVLSFPAIAEQDETFIIESTLGNRSFERKVGEALHPESETLQTLARIRERMGDYNYSSQYQQNPIPLGGAMVKTDWLRYYEPGELAKILDIKIQSWDTANKSTELSDYSVCTTWGHRFTLLNLRRAFSGQGLLFVITVGSTEPPSISSVDVGKLVGCLLLHSLGNV